MNMRRTLQLSTPGRFTAPLKNEKGVVFATVLMIIIVAMVLTSSIISMNVSQVVSVEDEVQHIQARELARGAIFMMVSDQESGAPADTFNFTETLDGVDFTVDGAIVNAGGGPFSTDEINIDVDF